MTETTTPSEGLVLRAGIYQLLAIGYTYPQEEYRQRVRDLVADLAPWVGLIQPEWTEKLQALRDSLDATAPEDVEAEFNRLFSGNLDASPYETAYEPDIFRKQNSLADIAGFYKAFGFEVAAGSRWQPDHIGVQMEFCAIVLQRTSQAIDQGWDEQASISVAALRSFLLDHLGRWYEAFCSDLTRTSDLPFYHCLAELTRLWAEVELKALDLEPDRLHSRKVYADDLDAPTCGGCTGCGPEGPTKGAPCPTQI